MYGKSNKIGIFLGTVFTVALVASLIVPLKQPRVGQVINRIHV